MSIRPTTAIFDLDGTLIDSAPSILEGFGHTLQAAGVTPALPLTPDLIGPPLNKVMAALSGQSDPALVAQLIAGFKAYYDTVGYLRGQPYPGVHAMLEQLRGQGVALHLATNKRHAPTVKILEALGWLPLFDSVYALDRAAPSYADKRAMLAAQLAEQGMTPAHAAYIGDRDDDRLAAEGNGIPFIAVAWGYGAFNAAAAHPVLSAAAQLPHLFFARN